MTDLYVIDGALRKHPEIRKITSSYIVFKVPEAEVLRMIGEKALELIFNALDKDKRVIVHRRFDVVDEIEVSLIADKMNEATLRRMIKDWVGDLLRVEQKAASTPYSFIVML